MTLNPPTNAYENNSVAMPIELEVETCSGRVRGVGSRHGRYWLGIPFARADRFGLPQAPRGWRGVRDGSVFGPECPQYFGSFAPKKKIDSREVSEHCLVLNVWAPPAQQGDRKPVMVWVHGGAFVAGSGNLYDGAELAARGDIVVVTVNYRLGVLGFVNLGDALGLPEIPSNLGLRDQIAALEWVRDNIAAFGGDPSRVTVAGESAGAIAISMLLLSERARPLIHGAILQSGAISLPHSIETSRRIAQRYCEVLDLKPGDMTRLQSVDLRALLTAQSKVHRLVAGTVPSAPWFDGELFPASLAAARSTPTPAIPLLAGCTREEIRTFEILRGPPILPMTRADNERLIREQLEPAAADALLRAYPNTKHGNRALATDLTFAMPTQHFAERHAVHHAAWFYRFDYSHPLIGAAHGIDLAFVWPFKGVAGLLMRGGFMSSKRRALAEQMQSAWVHFVKHGRAPEDWPRYTASRRAIRLFDLHEAIVEDPDRDRRLAWAGADISTTGL